MSVEGNLPSVGIPLYFIGTSGWAYREWRHHWYPSSLPPRAWLSFYAEHFPTVEVNSTFYTLPPSERFQTWARSVPPTFRFAIKAPRSFTHEHQLQIEEATFQRFRNAISGLGARLGPILWQLPPHFPCDTHRLRRFLAIVCGNGLEHAIEFRHPSWDIPEVWELLQSSNVAIVWSSSLRYPSFRLRTAPFLYVRFHGLQGGYAHRYTEQELYPWAESTAEFLRQGYRMYAYFNNTAGTAPYDALRFRELVERLL